MRPFRKCTTIVPVGVGRRSPGPSTIGGVYDHDREAARRFAQRHDLAPSPSTSCSARGSAADRARSPRHRPRLRSASASKAGRERRRAAGVHDLAAAELARRFEYEARAFDVDAIEVARVPKPERVAGGGVHDRLAAGERAPHAAAIEQIQLAKLDRKPLEVLAAEVRADQRGHVVAAAQQLAHHLRADEAVGAGDGAAADLRSRPSISRSPVECLADVGLTERRQPGRRARRAQGAARQARRSSARPSSARRCPRCARAPSRTRRAARAGLAGSGAARSPAACASQPQKALAA